MFLTPYQDNSPRQFTFAVISEQAYNYLLNSVEKSKRWDDSSMSRDVTIEGFAAALEKRMTDFDSPDKHEGKYAKGGEGYDSMRRMIASDTISSAIEGRSNVRMPFYLKEGSYDYAAELIKDGKLSEYSHKKLKESMGFGYIMEGLNELNIKISPMVYSGQDYDNSIGKAYAKMIKTVSAQITKQQKARYEE